MLLITYFAPWKKLLKYLCYFIRLMLYEYRGLHVYQTAYYKFYPSNSNFPGTSSPLLLVQNSWTFSEVEEVKFRVEIFVIEIASIMTKKYFGRSVDAPISKQLLPYCTSYGEVEFSHYSCRSLLKIWEFRGKWIRKKMVNLSIETEIFTSESECSNKFMLIHTESSNGRN